MGFPRSSVLTQTRGPHILRIAGRNASPIKRPSITIARNAITDFNGRHHVSEAVSSASKLAFELHLQMVVKIIVVDKAIGITPSHVVNPPNIMEAPMVSRVCLTFASRVVPGVS